MPRGRKDIKSTDGRPFSKTNQPSNEVKRAGHKRLKDIKEAAAYFKEQLKSTISLNGDKVELTFESNIYYKLMEKANAGDLKAIELCMKVIPDFALPTKTENRSIDVNGNDKENVLEVLLKAGVELKVDV